MNFITFESLYVYRSGMVGTMALVRNFEGEFTIHDSVSIVYLHVSFYLSRLMVRPRTEGT